MATKRTQQRPMPRTECIAMTLVGFLGCCKCGTGFVPAAHRLARVSAVRRSGPTCSMKGSPGDSGLGRTTTGFSSASPMKTAAATCLATATLLSSLMPADASIPGLAGLNGGGDGFHRSGSPTSLVLSEGSPAPEDADVGSGSGSSSVNGELDIPGLVSELKGGKDGKAVLSTMIKINDIVDADEEGVLENSFAKESIVKGLIDKRRAGSGVWDGDTEVAFGILKRKLDPFNVVLLRPYLRIAPFLGGAYYLAVFFVQQKFRDFFPYAYFAAVAIFVAPAVIILVTN